MSAHHSAPGMGRAQVGPPAFLTAQQGSSIPTRVRGTRMTRRAMTVAAATLCAPLVATVGLAAFAAAGGEQPPEMGSLAGAQGLRGSTVEATSPAPAPQVLAPTAESPKRPEVVTPVEKSQTDPVTDETQRQEPPTTRAPTHKPPVQTTPKPRSPRVSPPAPAPAPSFDPTGPGAPTSTGGTSTSGSDPGSTSGPGYRDGPAGQSGDDD
jgi:outer membrane biosynthesis protein TonB